MTPISYPLVRRWAIGLAAVLLAAAITAPSRAIGTFIPAPDRKDMVYDTARQVLYITSQGYVLRYSTATNTFLPPYDIGGNLYGIDISPDGQHLAVTDSLYSTNQVWIWNVDLTTGTSNKVYFPRGGYGTYAVAYMKDGSIIVSGGGQLERYDPATRTATGLGAGAGMLSASADGSVVGFVQGASDGAFGRYRLSDGNMFVRSGYNQGTGWFNYEIGVSRDGGQYAIPTYGGTFITDGELNGISQVGVYASGQPVGVVYNPVADVVYFPWVGTSQVRAYDTKTMRHIASYDFEHVFRTNGNAAYVDGRMKMARDGSFLFATVAGGIQYTPVPVPYTMADVKTALRIAGGLASPNRGEVTQLDVEKAGTGAAVDMADAVRLSRKVAGLDANP